MNFRGYIKYVSRKPVGKKPEIFTTGGSIRREDSHLKERK